MLHPNRPLLVALFLISLIFLIGVLGFYFIGGQQDVLQAIYMTVITISTVGYYEATPLDEGGKLFTIIYIIVSFIVFAFAVRQIIEYVINVWAEKIHLNKKNKKMIKSLKDHTIVCGYGRNGRQAVTRLKRHQHPYIVIEKDPSLIAQHRNEVLFFEGNALVDEHLKACNINAAHHLIAALPNDADNLFIVLSARQLQPKMTIVSRASKESSQQKLFLAGADHVIMPDKIGGDYMAALLTVPNVVRFIETLSMFDNAETPKLEEVAIVRLPASYHHKSLAELDLRNTTGCIVVGFRDATGKQQINPDSKLKMEPGAKLIVLGNRPSLKKLNTLFELG